MNDEARWKIFPERFRELPPHQSFPIVLAFLADHKTRMGRASMRELAVRCGQPLDRVQELLEFCRNRELIRVTAGDASEPDQVLTWRNMWTDIPTLCEAFDELGAQEDEH